jgi:hypothetical protein
VKPALYVGATGEKSPADFVIFRLFGFSDLGGSTVR